MVQQLAKLVTVTPKEVWAHEEYDFTPWLLANADALAEVLGIDVDLVANEHPVGSFSLDLLGRDLTNDCVLIVENQLTGTDHDHLGKLVTYAAGTTAATVIWMATSFREEHRQALDWLNEIAQGNARFFGVEIGAVRIGDSPPAPLFKLRAQPNDWFAQIATAAKGGGQAGGKSTFYIQFWQRFIDRVQVERPGWTNAKKAGTANWLSMPCPFKGGPSFAAAFAAGGKIKTELYVDYEGAPDKVAALYEFLLERREEIEQSYGQSLTWEEIPNKRASRIADYSSGDVSNLEEHAAYINWFFDSGKRLREALTSPATEWHTELQKG